MWKTIASGRNSLLRQMTQPMPGYTNPYLHRARACIQPHEVTVKRSHCKSWPCSRRQSSVWQPCVNESQALARCRLSQCRQVAPDKLFIVHGPILRTSQDTRVHHSQCVCPLSVCVRQRESEGGGSTCGQKR